MQFKSKLEVVSLCFSKFKRQQLGYLLVVLIFLIGEPAYAWHRPNPMIFKVLFIFLSIGCFLFFMKFMYAAASMMNRVVKDITVDSGVVHFDTFDSSVIFGLIKKESQILDIPRGSFAFALAKLDYKFEKEYTGTIYVLDYAGTDYLLPENFYENFFELKTALTTKAERDVIQ